MSHFTSIRSSSGKGLEQDLNYNAMVSQRGILNLIHSDAQRDAFTRRGNAMILNGADADLLSTETIQKRYPFLNVDNARFPSKAVWPSIAAAQCAMTQSPGAMPVQRINWGWTSSKTAKSPAFAFRAAHAWASKPAAATSRVVKSRLCRWILGPLDV